MDPLTQANRDAWNALAKPHYANYHVDRLLSGQPVLSELIRSEVGEVTGRSLIHLLCHIGTDTLSWGLLGAQVTGVDISSESIRFARKLSRQLKLEATFINCDVMEVLDHVRSTFDIVFASTGVLCWLPDLVRFASTVRQLLKPGGIFYLHDGHPFKYILETSGSGGSAIKYDYFQTGPSEYNSFTDYATKDLVIPGRIFEWNWTLGEVVTAFCQSGMRIVFLHEYPQFFYGGYDAYDVDLDKKELYPCTFSLKAVAE